MPAHRTRTYSYDAVGDLIQKIDSAEPRLLERSGRKHTHDDDVLSRQTGEHWLDANGNMTFAPLTNDG